MCKDLFYENKVLIKDLEVKCYNNHNKKDINKWI